MFCSKWIKPFVFYNTPLPPYLHLLGSPMLIDPHPPQPTAWRSPTSSPTTGSIKPFVILLSLQFPDYMGRSMTLEMRVHEHWWPQLDPQPGGNGTAKILAVPPNNAILIKAFHNTVSRIEWLNNTEHVNRMHKFVVNNNYWCDYYYYLNKTHQKLFWKYCHITKNNFHQWILRWISWKCI